MERHIGWLIEHRNRGKKNSQNDEDHKLKGFTFIVVAAASGIGKTTFSRRVFKYIQENFKANSSLQCKQFLESCILKNLMFRISYVGFTGIDLLEKENPSFSLGLRVLYEYLKHRYDISLNLQSFLKLLIIDHNVKLFRLEDTLKWIKEREVGDCSFVIHLDETNHIDKQHNNFLQGLLSSLYMAMSINDIVSVISGTDTHRLSNLKETSNFNCKSVHLSPLSEGNIVVIFLSIIEKLGINDTEINMNDDLMRFLLENGGNPQILEFQIDELNTVGLPVLEYQSKNRDEISNSSVDIYSDYENSKQISNWNGEGLKNFIRQPTSNLVQLARSRTFLRLEQSHILTSLKYTEQLDMASLREIIFGYVLSGDFVSRDTKLDNNWNVGKAEKNGFFYLKHTKKKGTKEGFVIKIPQLYLQKYSWKGYGNIIDPFVALDKEVIYSRDVEHVDIEMVSFKIWWYLRKNNVINFTLRDIFPCSRISSSFRNISFKKPTDYSKSTLSEKFHFGLWDTLIAENWVFGLCCTGDSFVDSFALLHDSESTVWKLLIQSKLRKSGAGDHDFTQEDLNMQLDYIKNKL